MLIIQIHRRHSRAAVYWIDECIGGETKRLEEIGMKNFSQAIVESLPQKPPFRFLDRVLEVDDSKIIGEYTFKKDEWFYSGHFPGRPMTPGVILVEAMAQTAVVALGVYLMMCEEKMLGRPGVDSYLSVFSNVEAEFLKPVLPGTKVRIKGEKVFWRMRKLKAKAEMFLENGELAATATMCGAGVKRS